MSHPLYLFTIILAAFLLGVPCSAELKIEKCKKYMDPSFPLRSINSLSGQYVQSVKRFNDLLPSCREALDPLEKSCTELKDRRQDRAAIDAYARARIGATTCGALNVSYLNLSAPGSLLQQYLKEQGDDLHCDQELAMQMTAGKTQLDPLLQRYRSLIQFCAR